jgi:dihydroorotase
MQSLIESGAVGGKFYPARVTTNSEDGIKDLKSIYPLLEIMQERGIVLNIHGEEPESFCLDREKNFLKKVDELIHLFPRLRIVLEHISDRASVEYIMESRGQIAATITVHHLLLTLDDVIGNPINPHHFCIPVAKTTQDRKALLQAAFSGNPKFFLGTDSAPHPREVKEFAQGSPGIYTAPVAVPLLVQIFDKAGNLNRLEDFTSKFGSEFYQLPINSQKICFIKQEWTVPDAVHGIVPFYAGQKVSWKLEQ